MHNNSLCTQQTYCDDKPCFSRGWSPAKLGFFVFACLNEFEMLKWLQKWIDQPQIIYKTGVTIVSRTNSYFAMAHSVFQDGGRRPFWIWVPHGVCPHFHNRHPSQFFYSTFMDVKSIEKTTSALNGHGIAADDPTMTCNYCWFNMMSCHVNSLHIEGILPKGPYPPCLRMAGRALLAGYPRYVILERFFLMKLHIRVHAEKSNDGTQKFRKYFMKNIQWYEIVNWYLFEGEMSCHSTPSFYKKKTREENNGLKIFEGFDI